MNINFVFSLLVIFVVSVLLLGCVSIEKYNDLEIRYDSQAKINTSLLKVVESLINKTEPMIRGELTEREFDRWWGWLEYVFPDGKVPKEVIKKYLGPPDLLLKDSPTPGMQKWLYRNQYYDPDSEIKRTVEFDIELGRGNPHIGKIHFD